MMGILNVTPDKLLRRRAAATITPMRRAPTLPPCSKRAAAIIDIGGESTRPRCGRENLRRDEEIRRVVPAVRAAAEMGAAISVDTRRAGVLEAAISAGRAQWSMMSRPCVMIRASVEVAAPTGLSGGARCTRPAAARICTPGGKYLDVVCEVFDFLRLARERAIVAGIAVRANLIDPGIGFGKSLGENLALINALPLVHALGSPLMLGASRKAR